MINIYKTKSIKNILLLSFVILGISLSWPAQAKTEVCQVTSKSLSAAKRAFRKTCGTTYDKSLGHDCDRLRNGYWSCFGKFEVAKPVTTDTETEDCFVRRTTESLAVEALHETCGGDVLSYNCWTIKNGEHIGKTMCQGMISVGGSTTTEIETETDTSTNTPPTTEQCFVRRTTETLAVEALYETCGGDVLSYNCWTIKNGEHIGKAMCQGTISVGGESTEQTTTTNSTPEESVCEAPYPSGLKRITVQPGQSIQMAIDRAEPGTIIEVKAGTYREAIYISSGRNQRLKELSASQPIILKSVDGRGRAIIEQPSSGQEPPISIMLVSHIYIDGFQIKESYGGRDVPPIKIINGRNDSTPSSTHGHIHIYNNDLQGQNQDIIKVARAHNISIVGNTLSGSASDAGVDFVTVWNSDLRYNTFSQRSKNGITMKGGSQNITFANNLMEANGLSPSINIGGEGHSRENRDAPDNSFIGFEAKNVQVSENVVYSDGSSAFWFQGARDSVVSNNYIKSIGGSTLYSSKIAPSSPWNNENASSPVNYPSRNNSMVDNILDGNFGNPYSTSETPTLINNSAGAIQNVTFNYGHTQCK